jgi:hypothetical protein
MVGIVMIDTQVASIPRPAIQVVAMPIAVTLQVAIPMVPILSVVMLLDAMLIAAIAALEI